MTEYVSHGDPRRSMALLWGKCEPPTRGPKQALTVPEIVAAAVDLADTEGLGAVSMRKVADRLGRSPMALYTYVPAKAELLDLMLDSVLGEVTTDYPYDQGWRAAAEASARAGWAFYERHPWVLQISQARSLLGPHELDLYEAQLRIFDGLPLTGRDVNRLVTVMSDFVRGAARAVHDARQAPKATGLTDDEWWTTRSALLEEMAPPDMWATRWPTITRIGEEAAFDQQDREPGDDTPYIVWELLDSFEFGLQRLLDGIERYISSRAP
ncbi:MAG TPA: TetR/AcrR family transcriptional regulator [Acidimicrobiales bacterium]